MATKVKKTAKKARGSSRKTTSSHQRIDKASKLVFAGKSGADIWREGSAVRKRWARVRPGMTVEQAVAAGATMGDIRYATSVKNIVELKAAAN
jgi:hypothetical protein